MAPLLIVAVSVLLALMLGFIGAPLICWTVLAAGILYVAVAPTWLWITFGVVAVVFNLKPIRRKVVSSGVMKIIKGVLPAISDTERAALDAGVVWVEGELFSGKPDFKAILREPYPNMTEEEKLFMAGPVERLCEIADDWEIWEKRDLPKDVWDFVKREKFFGMIIPKEYGGLGFSALAHSEVIQKLSSRSIPLCTTVMVPNSLGPAELLIHYGTEDQKNKLLPKLATGEELPCFALTEPTAGSDAGSITASGILFRGSDGKLKIKLNWNKRWITLAAVSTTLGLAFRLRDPENFLGKGEDVGITCALVPSKTPGVDITRRHDPLGCPFFNCPTQGKDVIVDAEECIVGGLEGAGKGWSMLMECLAAGRGISLPAQSTGGAKHTARVTSAHAVIRKQFGVSIGKFEGVEEPLARIGGYTYLMEAMRRFTLGALDKGIKPPVITAIAKYHATELGRKIINDGMDIVGGAGISMGPRNTLAHLYISTPIGITVEGANIMTRTLIIFGQGALRAHPYAYKEIAAVEKNDVKAFDDAFWGHIRHVVRNLCRAVVLSFTRGALAPSPVGGSVSRYYRRMAWTSATFAIMADIAMGSLGGALKQREKITGRFADILSWMYIGTSVLRRFQAEGSRKEDLPLVHFAMNYCFSEIQKSFDGIFANIPVPGLSWFFRIFVRAWSNINPLAGEANDQHTHKIATLLLSDTEQRERLLEGSYVPSDITQAVGRLENAFHAVKRAEAIEKKVRDAVRAKTLPKVKGPKLYNSALEAGVISQDEYAQIAKAEELRLDAIQVDDFRLDEYLTHSSTDAAPKKSAGGGSMAHASSYKAD